MAGPKGQRREVTQMSKKILTVLAPVAALIAFAMVPTMAQATTLQAPHGTTLPSGSTVVARLQSGHHYHETTEWRSGVRHSNAPTANSKAK